MNKYYAYKLIHKIYNCIYVDGYIYANNEIEAHYKLIEKIKELTIDLFSDEKIIIEKLKID